MTVEIADFKDKHKGERCFVLGCGPSLRHTNLDLIADEISFAMNNICLIYPQTKWRPTYYWNTTTNVNRFPSWLAMANEAVSYGQPSFIRLKSPISDAPNVIRVDVQGARYKWDSLPMSLWTPDAADHICLYRMSAYGLMQLVQYMGCNPVYFLGFDGLFVANAANHFSPDYEAGYVWTAEQARHETIIQRDAHERVKACADYFGIDIYDCTVDGHLAIYPKAVLEEIDGIIKLQE